MKSLFPFALLLCTLGGYESLRAESGGPANAAITPGTMSAADINAHNRQLDRNHPDYSRCERGEATGSRIGTKRTCRTNARWDALALRARR